MRDYAAEAPTHLSDLPYDPWAWEPPEAPANPSANDRPHLRDRVLTLEQLRDLPPADPLIDGLLYRHTLGQLSGPPGSLKTFLALGMACALSAGRSWEGHRIPRAGSVLYIAAEGASGLARRIDAWQETNDTDTGDLLVYPEPLQLGDKGQVRELEELAGERQTGIVIFDTRARCTAGLEENSATDQGIAIEAAERIRRASNGTALVVHHSGINGGHGRGSTAWDGAVWSDLRVTRDEMSAKLHVEKHKDAPDGTDYFYRMLPANGTLVAVAERPMDVSVLERASTVQIRKIIWTTVGQDGLSKPQVATFAAEQNISRSSAYAAIKALVDAHELRNVGTATRPRYVPTGEQEEL